MKRIARLLVLVVALLMVVGASPAMADRPQQLKATLEASTMPPITDPGALAARCPAASGWIFGGLGTGAMTSAVYEGTFTFTWDHCSRWVTFDPERTTGKLVGKAEAGRVTITTPGGVINVGYEGTWVFDGSLGPPPDFVADLHLHYTIEGGTGDFAGARGHGRLLLSGDAFQLEGMMNGSFHAGG